MSSPDHRTFVESLISDHTAWLGSHLSPTGSQFLEHYIGGPAAPSGLLWQYEAWRVEHGYTRVRQWNGSEPLGRVPIPGIPSPGRVFPWVSTGAGPVIDTRLSEGRTTAQLQSDFATENALGAVILDHWNTVRTFGTSGDIELEIQGPAPYSIRFWAFMKWAALLRNRWAGIPVFAIPIVYDAEGVPLSDLEYMEVANRWHEAWHLDVGGRLDFPPAWTQTTAEVLSNPFAPTDNSFGQFAGRKSPFSGTEFMRFHRSLLNTFDSWRRRAGMPPVGRYKPLGLHFHPHASIPETLVGPQGLTLSEDEATQLTEIKSVVRHFNTLEALGNYCEDDLHAAGHGTPESEDIADPQSNNYSPRFMAWHRWIDFLWEVRQPRFGSLRSVTNGGADYPAVLTVVHPPAGPDEIFPANALTGLTPDGRGSLWLKHNVRPENWGRDVSLTVSAQVYRDSDDLAPVAALAVTQPAVTVSAAQQGSDSAAVEIQFDGLEAGEGAFAQQTLAGGSRAFKNGRIRITSKLAPIGAIAGSSNIGAATDQFEHEEYLDVILVKDGRPPAVSTLLNKSSFSVDEIAATPTGFPNSIFVVVQDPPEPPVALAAVSIFADPARSTVSGVPADASHEPDIVVVDEGGTPVDWFTVSLMDVFPEQPSLPIHLSQRVLFRYRVDFDVGSVTSLLTTPGAVRYARLQIVARDRSGNVSAAAFSPQIKLFNAANPYMIDIEDENPHWLSVDTRVFSVQAGEMRLGHSVSASGGPNAYIQDVLASLRDGTADYESVPSGQEQSPLELAPTVSGQPVHNFAIARVRMKTSSVVSDVRVFFRLFTTALSNLSFNQVNYLTSPGALSTDPRIALLGRTAGAEIVSVPFFAASRVETRDTFGGVSMETQSDAPNVQQFDPAADTPNALGELVHYYGAYLDINSDTARFPAAPAGNGPFPAPQCVSIRNILRGQHECMAAEVFFFDDPTEPNETPGTSDNLAQRNLLIVEAANPGMDATHTVQHSFDIALPNRKERDRLRGELRRQRPRNSRLTLGDELSRGAVERVDEFDLRSSIPAWAFARLEDLPLAALARAAGSTGLRAGAIDELAFFWDGLPPDSEVEVYLPSLDVEHVVFLRDLRRAPKTVRAVDGHTLSLEPVSVTYLPIPNTGRDRAAGLLTVKLPDVIKAGELFKVDVLQLRPATGEVLGGFQLMIPIGKAAEMYERDARLLSVFEERLKVTPSQNRWHPILLRQVEYFRARAHALAEEAADECAGTRDRGGGRRVRVIVDKIKVLDVYGPLAQGSGEVSLVARVTSSAAGTGATRRLPETGAYPVEDMPEGWVIEVNREIFRGSVIDDLAVELMSSEEEGEESERRCHYRRVFTGEAESWLGAYEPRTEKGDPEDVGDWQVWYRIEQL